MKRKMFFGERMLYGDGVTPFNLVFPLKLKGKITESELKTALKGIQEKHPWLTASVEVDEKNWPRMKANSSETFPIPIRIIERYSDDDWQKVSQEEWSMPFDATKNPLLRLVWLRSEEVSEILLVIHHCLSDGTATISIVKALLALLDNPKADIGKEKPILSLQDIVPQKVLKSFPKRLKNGLIGKITTTALRLIPVKKTAVERQQDYMLNWKLTEAQSKAIIQFCKTHQFTVNTLLSGALLSAFKSVRGTKAFNKISLPVDVRNYNPLIKTDHIFAFGLMIVLSADLKKGFIDQVKTLQADASQKLSKLNPYSLMLMMESCHSALRKFSNLLKYGKSSNDCMFSNLGKLDIVSNYKNFEIETIFSPSVIGPLGNTTTLVTSTYRGQMDFSFMFSEGYLPYAEGKAIKEKMMEILDNLLTQPLTEAA